MAHHKSAKKRIKTSHAANVRNRSYRAALRIALRHALEDGGPSSAENLRRAYSVLDRLVSRGIIHRNTAARRKSRISLHFLKVTQPASPVAPPAS